LNYNFDPGKTKFDASNVGSNFIISGKQNDPKTALRGGIVDQIGSSSQMLSTSRQDYLNAYNNGEIKLTPEQLNMVELGRGENLTKDELESLQQTNSLKFNDFVQERVFIPRNEYRFGKMRGLVRGDDNKISDDDLYHTEVMRIGGKEINENLIDKDAVQYMEKDSPAGKKYGTDGYYVNGQAIITPLDRERIDNLMKANKEIQGESHVDLEETSGGE